MSPSAGESATRGEGGFTLIELLVVVIILGILAAIAIPIFLNQREQAQDAAAKSTVRNAATAVLVYQTEYGEFPAGDQDSVDELVEIEPTTQWTVSQNTHVPLTTADKVGVVPFEWVGTDGSAIVFGTRSASGECFYMRIDANGNRYGHDSQCEDPWEANRDGRVTATGW